MSKPKKCVCNITTTKIGMLCKNSIKTKIKQTFFCTRKPGHKGNHVACGMNPYTRELHHKLYEWPQEKSESVFPVNDNMGS